MAFGHHNMNSNASGLAWLGPLFHPFPPILPCTPYNLCMKTPSQIPRPTSQSVPPKFKEFLDFDFLPFYRRASLKMINIFESAVVTKPNHLPATINFSWMYFALFQAESRANDIQSRKHCGKTCTSPENFWYECLVSLNAAVNLTLFQFYASTEKYPKY